MNRDPDREREDVFSPVRGIALGLVISLVLWAILLAAVRFGPGWFS